jgi:hypothetical protein
LNRETPAAGESESYQAWLEMHPEAQGDVRFCQEIMSTQAITSDPRAILPGQLGILLTSLIMGYACLWLLRDLHRLLLKPTMGALGFC